MMGPGIAALTAEPVPKPTHVDPGRTAVLPAKSSIGLTLSNPASIYEPVELPDITITLVGAQLPPGVMHSTPDAGQRFVSPALSVYCLLPPASDCQTLGPFELIDSHGTRHSPVRAAAGEGFLPSGDFPGGTTIEGALVFMVPIDASPMTLRYVGHQGQEAYFLLE